ncbi:MAG: hypothetical protein JW934_13285 [Anaerolineae bacterium]|nr:hypothetical protein [Anaerolineae bacterium]
MALDWLKSRLIPAAAPGLGRRNRRIDAEVLMIAKRFSRPPYQGIYYDDENRDWLIVPGYPLPARFRERHCDLLIVFPETYPETPPIGFYLNKPFVLHNGQFDPHATGKAYHGAPDLTEQGWHWYCVQMDMQASGAWTPHADPGQPDNLWTFLNMVRESLTNDG